MYKTAIQLELFVNIVKKILHGLWYVIVSSPVSDVDLIGKPAGISDMCPTSAVQIME